MKTKILIAGIGNSFRSDDKAGLLVCDLVSDALTGTPFKALIDIKQLSGEGAELMDEWQGYDAVYVADASQIFGNPGKVTRIDASTTPLQSDYFHYSSHNFSLAEAVELARHLDKLPQKLVVFAIEGQNFGFGVELSYEVQVSCMNVARNILNEIFYMPEKVYDYIK